MDDLEFLLALLAAAAALIRLADAVRVPYPILLVLGGLGIGLLPGLPSIELDPEVVFLVFVPPLVHAAAWTTSPQALRAEVRPLAILAIGLVAVTAVAVACVARLVVDDMSWAEAATLGAIVAATDAVAATATFNRLGVSERVRLLVEGESMLNDATALVLYNVAVGVAGGEAFHLWSAGGKLVLASVGGLAAGVAIGWLSMAAIRRQADTGLIIFITLLTPYAAYILAENAGASGILAAVVSGLWAGWHQHDVLDADTRLSAIAFWKVLVLVLEATLFILLGLQFPDLLDALGAQDLVTGSVIVLLVAVATRLLVAALPGLGLGDGWRERVVVGWSGMRGAVSLAAALAVPLDVGARPQIVVLTFAVVLGTLVGQGLTLPALVRRLGVRETRRWSTDEAIVRLEAAQAVLDRLDEIEEEGDAAEDQLRRLRDLYRVRFRVCVAVLGGEEAPDAAAEARRRARSYGSLRRDLIGVERAVLADARRAGRLNHDVLRAIERDLDLDEARIRA